MPVKHALLWVALFVWPSAALSQDEGQYNVVPAHSQIRFSVKKWSVLDVEGLFTRYRGEIRYDAQRPERCSVNLEVETASVFTGEPKRDESLLDPGFFDSRRVPLMKFASTKVTRTGKGEMLVAGNLTIKDTTGNIVVRVQLLGIQDIPGEGRLATFQTQLVLDRRTYGVLGGPLSRTMIGNDVSIRLTLGTKRTAP